MKTPTALPHKQGAWTGMAMELMALMKNLGFRALLPPGGDCPVQISQVYAGDRMSDLLGAADEHTLILTHLTNQGIVRLIELMDVPAICFLNGAHPGEPVFQAARTCGAVLFASPLDMFETCGRIYSCLHGSRASGGPQ